MLRKTDQYINRMGGDVTQDFYYFREITYRIYTDSRASRLYLQLAKKENTTYEAVQKAVGRAAALLWEEGKDILRKDLDRPNMIYPGPLNLARWIAYIVSNGASENW